MSAGPRPQSEGAAHGAACSGAPAPAAWPSFIETQFPVSLLSKESYKERKANYSQTLTGLGKWWGRKPLILVRAVLLGLLLPASGDPRRDREVFLALLTMDAAGLRRRKNRAIPLPEVYRRLDAGERRAWFDAAAGPRRLRLKQGTAAGQRQRLQLLVFDRLSYDEKLAYCARPEQVDGPSAAAWEAINAHLGTAAASLAELVRELGRRRFGRVPRVGDAFCGGGSVPFEAARIGCDAYGSDLNPVAALLTWGALHLVGGGEATAAAVRGAQERAFRAVDRQLTEWRLEHDESGWRADAFLYCTETRCPECGWMVPLAPSWVLGQKTRTVAELEPQPARRRFAIRIRSGVTAAALAAARAGTTRQSRLVCPNPGCGASSPMAAIRGDRRGADGRGYGLRRWESADLTPRPDDVFQERLYCVRWRLPRLDALLRAEQERGEEPAPLPAWVPPDRAIGALSEFLDAGGRRELAGLRGRDWPGEDAALDAARRELEAARGSAAAGAIEPRRRRVRDLEAARNRREALAAALTAAVPAAVYREVRDDDLEREDHALALVSENLTDWQRRGFLPDRAIAPGDETTRLIRERGWTHWHHLFTPRQLLTNGLLLKQIETAAALPERAAMLLGAARCADWNSKLSRWWTDSAHEKVIQTCSNQALNTLATFGSRGHVTLSDSWFLNCRTTHLDGTAAVSATDVRAVDRAADIWITDPPYADAINYHECGASRRAPGACCSPPPPRCSSIPSRRSTCWTRWRRGRTRCWGRPAAAGGRRRPTSTSGGTGCAIRCRRARKGPTSRFCAGRWRWPTSTPMRRAARPTDCVPRTGSVSTTGSGGFWSATTLPARHRPAHPRVSRNDRRCGDRRAIPHAGAGAAARRRGGRCGRAAAVPGRCLRTRRGVLPAARGARRRRVRPHHAVAAHRQHDRSGAPHRVPAARRLAGARRRTG